jgi:hypothetical protein
MQYIIPNANLNHVKLSHQGLSKNSLLMAEL